MRDYIVPIASGMNEPSSSSTPKSTTTTIYTTSMQNIPSETSSSTTTTSTTTSVPEIDTEIMEPGQMDCIKQQYFVHPDCNKVGI